MGTHGHRPSRPVPPSAPAAPALAVVVFAAVAAAALAGAASAAAADKAPALRLPPDLVFAKAEGSPGPVVFSHATHVAIADKKCVGCHPQPFRILRPTRAVTHDEMNAGKKCGVCHDGRTASGVQDDCDHCHTTAGGP